MQQKLKSIQKIYTPRLQPEGDGAMVMRVVGGRDVPTLDPFLMLDYFSTKLPAGFPDHPHRGFQTVTYLQKGSIYHEDFMGNKGILEPGDIQWMTAGKGIVHAEMPGKFDELTEGFQLWINLEKKNKMCDPYYQEFKSEKLPIINKEGASVKVVSGESLGQKGPINADTPTFYLDIQLQPNTKFEQLVPKKWNSLLFIYEGDGKFGSELQYAKIKQAIQLKQEDADILQVQSGEKGCKFMLMAGKPIDEPVAWHGPFVMNTQEEIYQTFDDYQNCKNGFEHRKNWESKIQQMSNKQYKQDL